MGILHEGAPCKQLHVTAGLNCNNRTGPNAENWSESENHLVTEYYLPNGIELGFLSNRCAHYLSMKLKFHIR